MCLRVSVNLSNSSSYCEVRSTFFQGFFFSIPICICTHIYTFITTRICIILFFYCISRQAFVRSIAVNALFVITQGLVHVAFNIHFINALTNYLSRPVTHTRSLGSIDIINCFEAKIINTISSQIPGNGKPSKLGKIREPLLYRKIEQTLILYHTLKRVFFFITKTE